MCMRYKVIKQMDVVAQKYIYRYIDMMNSEKINQ